MDAEATVVAYFDGLNAKDTDALAALFDDNATLMLSESETATGIDSIRALFGQRFHQFDYGRKVHVDETWADGEVTVIRCHSTGTLTLLPAGTVVEAVAREVFIVVRRPDGWKIACYMNNMPGARPQSS